MKSIPSRVPHKFVDGILVLPITFLGFAVMGYHPGLEDDGIYLSAVKADIDPSLYPRDADFFRLQLQASVFDRCIAWFIRVTHIPVAWTELLWQVISLYLIVLAGRRILQALFPERRAQWCGVALLAGMFTLPVAGTALNIADQHLHPRIIATALILFAVERILAHRLRPAAVLLLLALGVHPIMAALGVSFCVFLALAETGRLGRWLQPRHRAASAGKALAGAVPLRWVFEPPTPEWRRALATRTYYFLYKWTWYEWLGAMAPLALFWLLRRYAMRRGETRLARFALAVLVYGIFQQVVAMMLLASPALVRVTPLQPMRYLHLVYIFLALAGGALLGRHVLHRSAWRWGLFLLAVNGGMFLSQRMMFPDTEHIELPGRASRNPWVEAFAWIRQNTPADAYFALDPNYLAAPGEDYHSFRALAERSQLADGIKDAAVVTQVPELGPAWARQVDAQAGWSRFEPGDFERLRMQFGVEWVLVSYPAPAGLDCKWHNRRLAVCRIPAQARRGGLAG